MATPLSAPALPPDPALSWPPRATCFSLRERRRAPVQQRSALFAARAIPSAGRQRYHAAADARGGRSPACVRAPPADEPQYRTYEAEPESPEGRRAREYGYAVGRGRTEGPSRGWGEGGRTWATSGGRGGERGGSVPAAQDERGRRYASRRHSPPQALRDRT